MRSGSSARQSDGVTSALTLTLSPREREQQLCGRSFADGRWTGARLQHVEPRRTDLPLPGGEGWGEGERFTNWPGGFQS